MEKEWMNLHDMFDAIKDEEYVVLRNFENLISELKESAHPDIDFLCGDTAKLVNALGLVPRVKKEDGMHYKCKVAGKYVDIDLRHVGDGYYDTAWEKEILSSRRMFDELCYVPDETNWFYSLLYHAVIQKYSISDDYKVKLSDAKDGLDFNSRASLVKELEAFMVEKGYIFTYPENVKGIFNTAGVTPGLVENDLKKKISHGSISILKQMVKKVK